MSFGEEHGSGLARARTANESFKARWDARVRWATCVAVVAHAAVFAFSPTWTAESFGLESSDLEAQQVISLGPLDASSVVTAEIGLAAPPVPVPVENPVDGSELDDESRAAEDEEEAELLAAWARLSRRLAGRGQLVAEVAAPGAGSERGFVRRTIASTVEDDPADEVEEETEVEVEETLADLALPEPDSLRLERLSGVSPELAVMTASAWVLIRNQSEIESYMRRSYSEGRLDQSVEGSVSVTLWIDQQGSVEWAEITESSGYTQLDEFALALFNEVADFRAARERGQRVSRSVTFSLNFPW